MTCEAAVRLRPAPPALRESTKNGISSSSWNRRTSSLRFLTSVSPCRTRPARPNTEPRNAASGAVVEPLRGMVADLLQPHEKGEDHASSLYPIDVREPARQFFHGLLVKRGLPAAQEAKGFHLGLVGQICDDALVGFETPQDIGA